MIQAGKTVHNIIYLNTVGFILYQTTLTIGLPAHSANQRQLPRLLQDPGNCPLNACEVLKILTQHLLHSKPTHAINGKLTNLKRISYQNKYFFFHIALLYIRICVFI